MNILELAKTTAEEKGFKATIKENIVEVETGEANVPIKLVIKKINNTVEVLFTAEDLEDYIEDLKDSGEDYKEIITEHIEDLKNIARTIITTLSSKNIKVEDKLRETELDIIEAIEESEIIS